MKTILATLATIAISLIALPEKAEARSCSSGNSYTYVSGHTSCGCPVYTRRVVSGYDCYNRPTYRYYRVPVTHRCRSHYSSRSYRSHNHSYGHRNHYSRSSRNYGRSSINYRTRYGSVRICR
ncbi:MAG: hypothetical protein AB8F34_01405 [Akkermansiaceae bacterium]